MVGLQNQNALRRGHGGLKTAWWLSGKQWLPKQQLTLQLAIWPAAQFDAA
jgi:hypothetical protein